MDNCITALTSLRLATSRVPPSLRLRSEVPPLFSPPHRPKANPSPTGWMERSSVGWRILAFFNAVLAASQHK